MDEILTLNQEGGGRGVISYQISFLIKMRGGGGHSYETPHRRGFIIIKQLLLTSKSLLVEVSCAHPIMIGLSFFNKDRVDI